MRQTCIFSGSSHPGLVDKICNWLGDTPGKVALGKFKNGETSVEIRKSLDFIVNKAIIWEYIWEKERRRQNSKTDLIAETSVRDKNVFIVQSGSNKYGHDNHASPYLADCDGSG